MVVEMLRSSETLNTVRPGRILPAWIRFVPEQQDSRSFFGLHSRLVARRSGSRFFRSRCLPQLNVGLQILHHFLELQDI
jgi:hypothetical protein